MPRHRPNRRKNHGTAPKYDFLKTMSIMSVPLPINVPITTRGIGFITQLLMDDLTFEGICTSEGFPVYQFYRIMLAQLETKLSKVSFGLGGPRTIRHELEWEKIQAIEDQNGPQFRVVANFISAVGSFERCGSVFLPYIPNDFDTPIVDPVLVTYSNLRKIVTYLAEPENDREVRKYFYDHNAMPAARWEFDAENYPCLTNPDDFMPEVHTVDDLHKDIYAIRDLMTIVARRFPNSIHSSCIEYTAHGNPSILVSNDVGTLRCRNLEFSPRVPGQNMNQNARRLPVTGTLNKFWSSRALCQEDFNLGVAHLVGETPRDTQIIDQFVIRSSRISPQHGKIDYYYGILSNLFRKDFT